MSAGARRGRSRPRRPARARARPGDRGQRPAGGDERSRPLRGGHAGGGDDQHRVDLIEGGRAPRRPPTGGGAGRRRRRAASTPGRGGTEGHRWATASSRRPRGGRLGRQPARQGGHGAARRRRVESSAYRRRPWHPSRGRRQRRVERAPVPCPTGRGGSAPPRPARGGPQRGTPEGREAEKVRETARKPPPDGVEVRRPGACGHATAGPVCLT